MTRASGVIEHGHRLADELLERSQRAGAAMAEVFLKSVKTTRCRIGSLAIRSFERCEENGLALRVWMPDGRRGFTHTDDSGGFAASDLIAAALSSCRDDARRGVLPRLPKGAPELDIPIRGLSPRLPKGPPVSDLSSRARGGVEAELKETAHALMGAFSSPARSAVRLLEATIDWGASRTLIANSLGGVASFESPIGVAGLWVAAGYEKHADHELSVLRHYIAVDALDATQASAWAEAACWRAAASMAGRPSMSRQIPLLLEPRSAAAWVRHGLAAFSGRPPQARFEMPATAGLNRTFEIIDDGRDARIDGEGRLVRPRTLVRDGAAVSFFADSSDVDAPDELLGPMRRDSYRDEPAPGAMKACVKAGIRTRESMLADLGDGLFVTSLTPRSSPGSEWFLAEVRGVLVERGHAVGPIAGSLVSLPSLGRGPSVAEAGADLELDPAGVPVECPSLRIEGATLEAL